ncbi:MAG: CoA transferase [Gammaproteobacteria bacterium]|jgi:crotonobetainyl-CoA:carnitine CoA-transferase CaiB-like acyl-CoA transferase|nr:CoA transferase [Gammaproteobacteria bacterium]MBT5602299.1 CoA transferase [Gammaproteobacteria bacterium]MBT6246002.1 CoA transferase [Gammaproteobacteria bacterium]
MKPLEGITVLEFSTMITASFAAMMMAEQGARVIKVEPMNMGDPLRYIGANKGGISSLFANCNRGKQSMRVNLKDETGQLLIREMIPEVDIFIHNFRPGVMDKLNLGSEALRALNPKLIYTAISGFGKAGPLGQAPAYDPIIQAQAGLAATQGKEGEPAFFRTLICDKITAYTACQAITCALYVREKTGEGQHIDLSMLDSGLFFIFPDGFQNHTLLDEDHERGPMLIDLLYELNMTKDGAVTISAGTEEMQMRSLIAVGMEHLLADERFNSFEKMVSNLAEFKDLLRDAYLQYTTDEIIAKLKEADVPCARCLSKDEVLTQEQVVANGTVDIIDHPIMGKMRIIKSPARFGGERLSPARPSPDHGEHTDEVLREFSLPQERIDQLRKEGVVA